LKLPGRRRLFEADKQAANLGNISLRIINMSYRPWQHTALSFCCALLAAMTVLAEPAPQTILIRYQDQAAQTAASQADPSLAANLVQRLRSTAIDIVGLPAGSSMADTLAHYRSLPGVRYAEKSGQAQRLPAMGPSQALAAARPTSLASTGESNLPNDPLFDQQYALRNVGQTGGTAGVDIGVSQVWPVSTGSRDLIVAVIDSGIDYNQPDLSPNIWVNEAELNGLAGVDDDGNGVIDDIHGATFDPFFPGPGSGDSMDYRGTGTAVAAVIGAATNNGEGMAGVAWQVRLMGVSFQSPQSPFVYEHNIIEALDYAVSNGAQVCLVSSTFYNYSQGLMDVLEAAKAKGVMVIYPAPGNVDSRKFFPLSHQLDNVMGVGDSDQDDHLASFSSFGFTSLDLAAPAVDVLSIDPEASGGYARWSGQGFSAAHLAGAMVLIKSIRKYPAEC
jgi:hypothetical protein